MQSLTLFNSFKIRQQALMHFNYMARDRTVQILLFPNLDVFKLMISHLGNRSILLCDYVFLVGSVSS